MKNFIPVVLRIVLDEYCSAWFMMETRLSA